jgi:hypothetical protein
VLEWEKVLAAEKETPAPVSAASPPPLASPSKPSEQKGYVNFVYDVVLDELRHRLLFCGIQGASRFFNLNDGGTGVLLKPPGHDYIWRLQLSADREFICCLCTPPTDDKKRPGRIQVWNYWLLRTAAGLDCGGACRCIRQFESCLDMGTGVSQHPGMAMDASTGPGESTGAFAAQQAEQNEATARGIIQHLSSEDLGRAACCASTRVGRGFTGRTQYESEKALDAALVEARRALPEAPSAYKPTGRTTVAATVLMVAAAPLVLLLLLALCVALCWGFDSLVSHWTRDGSYSERRGMGVVSLFLDLVLVVVMVALPMVCFGALSKWFKNRKPLIPAVLTGLIDLCVAITLFAPIWKGETLAPTHLTFLFIPVRWLLIGVGGLVVPVLGALAVYGQVAGQKFCEETGRYLRRMRQVKLSFDFGENALELLRRGEYVAATRLPAAEPEALKQKHWSALSLWGHEQAATAFLELDMRFHGKSKPQKKLTLEEAKDKSKEWLAFSAQLTRSQAESLLDSMRG